MARSMSPGLDPKREERRLARKARRHTERREAIMRAARRLLGAQGIESFTVSAVAAKAEVSKPAVYYYFDSKEELVAALAAEVLRGETAAIREAMAGASDSVDRVARAVQALLAHHARDLERYRIAHVWPHLLGMSARLSTGPEQMERSELDADLARRLDEDAARGMMRLNHPAVALVGAAFAAGHGLLTAACAAHAAGTPEAVPLAELGVVTEELLRRGLVERNAK
jgi:AcrR family transcriptional regulator